MEHYTVRRYRDRDAKIRAEREAGASIADLISRYDLRKSRIYAIIKTPRRNNLGEP